MLLLTLAMTLPTNILVPTDFSAAADAALDYAFALASKLGARLHALHVIGVPELGVPELGVAFTSAILTPLILQRRATLDARFADRRTEAHLGEIALRTGDARDCILQTLAEVGGDLIVMGSHGRRGLSRLLLGSTAEGIVRTAPCPVLVVRAT